MSSAEFEFPARRSIKQKSETSARETKYRKLMPAMERYSIDQRVYFIENYYAHKCSAAHAVYKARMKYGPQIRLTISTVRRLVEKFEATGSVKDREKSGGPVTVRTKETISAVRDSMTKDPTMSMRRRAQQLGISYGSLRTILNEDLRRHPFTVNSECSTSSRSDAERTGSPIANMGRSDRGSRRKRDRSKGPLYKTK